jgi:hypothetical protein
LGEVLKLLNDLKLQFEKELWGLNPGLHSAKLRPESSTLGRQRIMTNLREQKIIAIKYTHKKSVLVKLI